VTPQQLSYPAWLKATARQCPGDVAVCDPTVSVSYAELSAVVDKVATAIRRRVEPGRPVALAHTPSASFVALFLGALASGAVPSVVNTKLTGPEVRAYLDVLDPALILHDSAHAALFAGCGRETLELPGLLADTLEAQLAPLAQGTVAEPYRFPGEDAAAVVFPTGGTTGLPKGCWSTHRQLLLWVWNLAVTGRRHRTEVELFVGPFFHVSLVVGVLTPLFCGGTVVVENSYDPEHAASVVARRRVTRLMGAPVVLTGLIRAAGADRRVFESVRNVGFGASSWTDEFCELLCESFPDADISAGYGATEFAGGVTQISPEAFRSRRFSGAGYPLPGCEVGIFDGDARRLPVGEVGDIGVRSPWQTMGYWNQPDETARTYGPDGFIRLGDIGYFDDTGWLYVSGRSKDMIVTGGENVFPAEVERALAGLPGVREVIAFGLPDSDWGERVEAVLTTAPGCGLSAAELRERVRDRLANYKVPKRIHIVDSIPSTVTGKPDRRAAQRRFGPQ